jgi:hypothetical protein
MLGRTPPWAMKIQVRKNRISVLGYHSENQIFFTLHKRRKNNYNNILYIPTDRILSRFEKYGLLEHVFI